MSATAELTHPATMALDRRAELIEELAPHGVSFGYQSTSGKWIETSTATLERVAPAFATKSSMLTAPPIICTPGRWHPELFGAMAWSVLALTLGGSSLLYLLIQRGAATRVTSLLYLVPPCTAVMAWLLFDESFGGLTLPGIALTVAGVAWVVRGGR